MMQDLTGTPPSEEDVAQATAVLKKSLVLYFIKLPPELAVEIPNVLRCLEHYRELRRKP